MNDFLDEIYSLRMFAYGFIFNRNRSTGMSVSEAEEMASLSVKSFDDTIKNQAMNFLLKKWT